MKSLVSHLVVALAVVSCTEVTGDLTSTIENQSTHGASLKFYRGNIKDTEFALAILPGERKIVNIGTVDEGTTYPNVINALGFDSLVLSFENKRAVHYNKNIAGKNPKALPFNSPRNLFNYDNWNERILKDGKKRFEAEYMYYITEEDYMNAE